jgi:hypothetical protein
MKTIVTLVTPPGHDTPVLSSATGNPDPVYEAAGKCDISNMTG